MSSAVLSVSCLTLGFTGYYFATYSPALKAVFEKKWGPERTCAYWIYFQRTTGVFFYGIVPFILIGIQGADYQRFGITATVRGTGWQWAIGLSAFVILLNYFAARSKGNLAMYPQIRSHPWSRSVWSCSALTWAAYLAAYEVLFRGFLLFSCTEKMDQWLAIALNCSFYALLHIHKGLKETLCAIPFGIVLCRLSLETGSMLPAALVHVALGLSNEWWSLWWRDSEA